MTSKDSWTRIGGIIMAAILIAALGTAVKVRAQSSGRSAIVVSPGQGSAEIRCVAFESEEISGLELLKRSGFDAELDVKGFGSAVCRIDAVGCPADDCFCECSASSECVYWSYWHLEETGWTYAAAGAGSYRVSHGDVDGWTWGPGSLNGAVEPPVVSFQEVCGGTENLAPAFPVGQDEDRRSPLVFLGILAALLLVAGYGFLRFRQSEGST